MATEPKLVVVDASVVVKWQLDDEQCVAQAHLLRDDFFARRLLRLASPHLMTYEVLNAMISASRRGRLDSEKMIAAIDSILTIGVKLEDVDPLAVLELAIRHEIAAYDAAYLALAESHECELWTGDKAFYMAVKGGSFRVKWIGDYRQA